MSGTAPRISVYPQLQNMTFSDEISSLHEPEIKCASVHLFSGVHLQCLLGFWLIKYEFVYFLLFLILKGSVPKRMLVSRAIFIIGKN